MDTGSFPPKRPLRKALYLQVRDVLTERISNGELKPGEAIANENDLARELGVSAGTVRKALELMEAQRVIRRRPGRGTFVNSQGSTELAARFCNFRGPDGSRIDCRVVALDVNEAMADGEERRQLGLATSEPVYRITRVLGTNGRAHKYEDATVPGTLFPDLAGKAEIAGSITALAQEYGLLLGRAEERIALGAPTAAAAQALGLAAGTPVMRRDRIVHALDGAPVEWAVAQWHLPGSYYLAEIV
jgi:GntR family transcriptional regulator